MCSVPFGLVAFGRVAALNYGSGSHGRLRVAWLGRRGRVGADDLSLGGIALLRRVSRLSVAALHDLRLDVALLDLGLDDGRRVDDGGRVGQLRLSFFLVLLV